MPDVVLEPGFVITHALLTVALVSLWASASARRLVPSTKVSLWVLPLGAALTSAYWSGLMRPVGLALILTFAAACYCFYAKSSSVAQRIAAGMLVFLLALALMAHVVPGLVTTSVATAYQASPRAVPYVLQVNLDKVLVGFFLLACGHALVGTLGEWRGMISGMSSPALITVAVVMSLALLLGHVTFDPKWTCFFFLWAWKNLFYTCVAEEAFFRGFVQRQLAGTLAKLQFGACASVLIAAALFGLAHYAGGLVYVVLATVAGIGYGWVYQHTGRIEASILTHFLLNCAHFLLFTYPALS